MIHVATIFWMLKIFLYIHFNVIFSITPILFSFIIFLGGHLELELTMPYHMEMNNNDLINPSSSTAVSSNNIDPASNNNENIKPWIDLKLVKYKGNYYAVDCVQRDGVNLIEQLQPQTGQEKPDLVNLRSSFARKGFKLDIDTTTKLSHVFFEGKKYEGHYVDLKYPNAIVTSLKIPIQKNDSGSIFIISKKA